MTGGDRLKCEGCEADCKEAWSFNHDGETEYRIDECPEKLVREGGLYKLVNLFFNTKNLNALPFVGGWTDQPAYVIDTMNILNHAQAVEQEQNRGA